jgi:CubicO group peptidase (beta-lactamase class C family)
MIVHHGRVVADWGDTAFKTNLHSVRKSLLSALIGIAVAENKIDLNATMAALGIDDNEPSLSDEERKATVLDLLKSRSGVYHPALYETAEAAAARPARGSHAPGTFWYYNNWDFNTLGTIYERAIGGSIFDSFERLIARPIGMQEYRPSDGGYVRGKDSIHPGYPIYMSARDLARFALLYLREGRWKGQQIVPADWVRASIRAYSERGDGFGYGYLWWTGFLDLGATPTVKIPNGTFSALGYAGQYALVIPVHDLVIVHRLNWDRRDQWTRGAPGSREIARLLWLILSAAGVHDVGPDASLKGANGTRLSSERLKEMIFGATLTYYEALPDGPYLMRLQADGTASYRKGRDAVEYDTGSWKVEGDRLCRERAKTPPHKTCLTAVLEGSRIQLFDENGLMEISAQITRA